MPVAAGTATRGPVPMEYAAEGSVAPMVALRDGRFKLTVCAADPPLLFDLDADPHETRDLAADPAHAATLARMLAAVAARWDLAAFDRAVRESQARRRLVYEALRNGAYFPWDHQPLQRASERYMRNHMDLNDPRGHPALPAPGLMPPIFRCMDCACVVHGMCIPRTGLPAYARITSRIPPATSAIPQVSRPLGRSPKA